MFIKKSGVKYERHMEVRVADKLQAEADSKATAQQSQSDQGIPCGKAQGRAQNIF